MLRGEVAAQLPLQTYEQVFIAREAIKQAVVSRTMPPWLPADCCNSYQDDFSLDQKQVATIASWVEQGAPQGEPLPTPPAPLPRVGGLSRVDLTISMPEPYTPRPEPGHIDDFRCFVIDWPLKEARFVTGINPKPGVRGLLHHVVIRALSSEDAKTYEELEFLDGRPGFACKGGAGGTSLNSYLGGGLLGSDYPEGYDALIEPGSKLILNMHYSTLQAAPSQISHSSSSSSMMM